MKILKLSPVLYVPDVNESVTYYKDILGFNVHEHDEENGWALLKLDEAEIMLSLPNAHIPFEKCCLTGSLYFVVKHVDHYWDALKDRTRICYDIENFPYGMREFAIYDNNGYLFQFGQELLL